MHKQNHKPSESRGQSEPNADSFDKEQLGPESNKPQKTPRSGPEDVQTASPATKSGPKGL